MEAPPPRLRAAQPRRIRLGWQHSSHPASETGKDAGERRAGGEARHAPPDYNLASLCDHIQSEGFNNGVFADVVLNAMESTYSLHRLMLSRSPYFRKMLQGPWKEANSPILDLRVDDKNVNGEAMDLALAYLYGHHPKLNDGNAFRVLAAASFLDLQDLCAICTDFIIAELRSSNFLTYQVFAESQDYGSHGERVRNACWGYLCQSGAQELKEVLPRLSSQTILALLTSDELWVPNEEKRFELALYILLAKCTLGKAENNEQGGTSSFRVSKKHFTDEIDNNLLETEQGRTKSKDKIDGGNTARNIFDELDGATFFTLSDAAMYEATFSEPDLDTVYANDIGMNGSGGGALCLEGPSDDEPGYQLNRSWMDSPCNVLILNNEWERRNLSPLTWGGRVVGKREVKTFLKQQCGMSQEEYDSFVNIFEGGSLLYCNMSFEALLNVRKYLEEMGFPCKAVNDGLWLQVLLGQRLQETIADTCKHCWHLKNPGCTCVAEYSNSSTSYNVQDENDIGHPHVYINNSTQGERNGLFRSVRLHDRVPIDGLAGIGRGTTLVPAAAWPPTRFVFSRVPLGIGNRSNQQPPANDDNNVDLAGDGLTALVGLSQGSNDVTNEHEAGPSITGSSSVGGVPVQMLDTPEHAMGIEWENDNSSILLDLKTPLNHFPPVRFAVEFQEVHRLSDGQVKHSPEVFYAGSLWKVSVQAFSHEDPQGRRTLGLFLHRRKAEITDPLRKAHMYVDSREKVTARYQLICPSKREVTVFGNLKQPGTLLPKAPKGWGWRSALLFDELGHHLQNEGVEPDLSFSALRPTNNRALQIKIRPLLILHTGSICRV